MGRITEITRKQAVPRIVERAAAALPQSASTAIFNVTGKVIINQIIGEVTTAIQNQACNAKLVADPSVGADVDMCAALNIANAAVGTTLNITGTLANAMVAVAGGAGTAQAAGVIVKEGAIELSCSASNTGAIKWTVHYTPIEKDAIVEAA